MKDKWDKLKILSDALKNNWPQILLIGSLLGSASGNIFQSMANTDLEAEAEASREQFSNTVNHLSTKKTTSQKGSKEFSRGLIRDHEQEYHR